MSEHASFIGGLELNFFPSATFESLDGISSSEQKPIMARNALRLLMMGWSDSWTSLLSWSTFKAVFVQRDPDLLRELRHTFQCGFDHLFTQLQEKELNEVQKEQVHIYLSNCLCLLPIADITPWESFRIPQLIEEQWVMVEYHVTPIELTQQTGVERFILQDKDRVFAYGLEPIINSKAKPHLIFMGTTYPAGQGFLPQVNTDMKGFETVGKTLYRSGRERILQWVNKQQSKIEVSGVSLGGSLSLLLAIDQGDKLSRVDAMNPAGLHDALRKSRYDHWDEIEEKPQVVIQEQARDPVSFFGVWKKEWNILKVIPPKEKQGPNALTDHFLNYAGFATTAFEQIPAEEDNKQRRKRNFWLYSIGRAIIYYPILLPFSYVTRPALNFIWEQKSYLAAALAPFIVFAALMFMGFLSGFLVLSAIACSVTALGAVALVNEIKNNNSQENTTPVELPQFLNPSLPRNPSMDTYQNTTHLELTHKELHSYYRATRCLMKQKDYLPDEDKKMKHMDGVRKRDLLLSAQVPENAEKMLSLKVTKAKAVQIRRTLSVVDQLSIESSSSLKSVLDEQYSSYSIGKR